MAPIATWTSLLTLAQSVLGVFMALLIVVSFVRLLPEPGTKTPFEGAPPLYNPRENSDARAFLRRYCSMSGMNKESLILAAAISALVSGGISLVLGYQLLVSIAAETRCFAIISCLIGGGLMIFGGGMTSFAVFWLARKSRPQA